jgi:trimethylamine--corrinoid protein Co-methyltransferase
MPAIRDLDALLTMLENTTKPVNCQPESTTGLQLLGEAAVILRGSVDAVREDPPFMLLEAPISPLKFPRVFVDTLLMAGEYGIPVEICPLPTGGATGPLTVAGSLLLTVVEHLAAITLIQTLYPGTPVIWAPRYAVMDMSTGNTGLGVEGVLASAAAAQLVGEYYGMIGDLYGPVSNGLLSDGKAVLESVLAGCTTALLGCPALLCGAGVLEVGLVACLEQLVIDNEIHGWIKRLFSWIKADQLNEIPHIEDLEGIFHKSGRNPAPSDPIVFRDWVEDRVKSKTLESEISPLDENIRRELKQLMMSQLN